MPSNYEAGRAGEYYVKRLLEEKGFGYVIRSAASRGPIDLLLSDGQRVIGVQVKGGVNPYICREDRRLLVEWCRAFGAESYLAMKRRGKWVLIKVDL